MGLLVGTRVSPAVRDTLVVDLPAVLAERFSGARWEVAVGPGTIAVAPGDSAGTLIEDARDVMLDAGWDLVVVLTDLPLREGRRLLLTQASPVHGVGLLSVPALGPVHVRSRALRAVVDVVGTLLGVDAADADGAGDPAHRVRQRAENVPLPSGEGTARFAARVLSGKVRVLLGMIRANRPWRLAVGLTRALSAAAATGVATLVTSDLWLLSATLGPLRLLALALLSVGAVSATLVVGAGLWERTRHGRGREQVMLFNMATTATVVIGVLVFYLALFVVSLVAALLLVDAGLFGEVIGRPAGMVEFGRLAWFTATLAAVGGAVGAGLETDDAVRHAAYTRDGAEAPSSD